MLSHGAGEEGSTIVFKAQVLGSEVFILRACRVCAGARKKCEAPTQDP